jgi:hypothetical protein
MQDRSWCKFNFAFGEDTWRVEYDRRRKYSIKQIEGFRFTWNFEDGEAELADNDSGVCLLNDHHRYWVLIDPHTDYRSSPNSAIYDIFNHLANNYLDFLKEREQEQKESTVYFDGKVADTPEQLRQKLARFNMFMVEFKERIAAIKAKRWYKFDQSIHLIYSAEDRDCELITKVIAQLAEAEL